MSEEQGISKPDPFEQVGLPADWTPGEIPDDRPAELPQERRDPRLPFPGDKEIRT
jgi:hypothetical protein